MLVDIIIPAHHENFELVGDCIANIEKHTDFAHRYILSLQGGVKEDFQELAGYLVENEIEATIIHEREVLGRNAAINEAMDMTSAKFIAVCYPQCIIRDDKWFGKLQSIFIKTPHPGIVGVPDVDPKSSNAPPLRLDKKYHHPTGPLFMICKVSLEICRPKGPLSEDDWQYTFSESCSRQGSCRWIHAGVFFSTNEHKSHPEARREGSGSNS